MIIKTFTTGIIHIYHDVDVANQNEDECSSEDVFNSSSEETFTSVIFFVKRLVQLEKRHLNILHQYGLVGGFNPLEKIVNMRIFPRG